MAKAEVVSDGVCEVAGQDVGLEGVHVDADAHGPLRADSAHAGCGRLTAGKSISSPENYQS